MLELMVCMTYPKTTSSYVWLAAGMTQILFPSFLTVVTVTRESLLVSSEVRMESYTHPTGSQLNGFL
jgi:hypothetical protein